MIHRFRIATTQATTIHQRATTKHKIIQGKNLTMGCCPHEKSHPFRNLNFPNSFPRESGRSCISNLMIKRPSIKLPTAIKILTKPVTPSTPRNSGLDEMKKGKGSRQLPIIEIHYEILNFHTLSLSPTGGLITSEIQAFLLAEHKNN